MSSCRCRRSVGFSVRFLFARDYDSPAHNPTRLPRPPHVPRVVVPRGVDEMPRFGHKVVAADAREEMTAYEAERAARIEANKARMRDLGILDATARLRATDAAAAALRAAVRAARTPKGSDADGNPAYRVADRAAKPAVATRRSGRLSGASPDDAATTTRTTDRDDDVDRNPETYSPAQVAALGSATKTWTLFVDGYDANGNRIYDSAIGATCHQVRSIHWSPYDGVGVVNADP